MKLCARSSARSSDNNAPRSRTSLEWLLLALVGVLLQACSFNPQPDIPGDGGDSYVESTTGSGSDSGAGLDSSAETASTAASGGEISAESGNAGSGGSASAGGAGGAGGSGGSGGSGGASGTGGEGGR